MSYMSGEEDFAANMSDVGFMPVYDRHIRVVNWMTLDTVEIVSVMEESDSFVSESDIDFEMPDKQNGRLTCDAVEMREEGAKDDRSFLSDASEGSPDSLDIKLLRGDLTILDQIGQ